MKHNTSQRGFSLVEMLVYIAILVMMLVLIVVTLVGFMDSYRVVVALRRIDHSAMTTLERMTRDIRGATSITAGSSSFGSHPGQLTLVETRNSISTTTRFYLDNGVVKVDVNSVYTGPLTTSRASVTSLTFTRLVGSSTDAVKVNMTIEATAGPETKSKNFQTTVVIKES